jgi:hypothetical protein
MKNLKRLAALVVVGSMLLMGCSVTGGEASVDPITYVTDGLDIQDVTSEHSDVSGVDSVKLYEADGASIEIWEFSSNDAAKAWCDATRDELKSSSTSNSGVELNGVVDYKYTVDGVYYRIMLTNATCVYSYGSDDAVEAALKVLKIND